MNRTIFGPQQIVAQGGPRDTPVVSIATVLGVDAPRLTALTLRMSRESWPAAGVDIEILVSFNGGLSYESPGPSHIAPFVADAKHTNVLDYPASIGRGWNQAQRQATHVKARTNNTGGNFQTTVTIIGELPD